MTNRDEAAERYASIDCPESPLGVIVDDHLRHAFKAGWDAAIVEAYESTETSFCGCSCCVCMTEKMESLTKPGHGERGTE